MTSTTETGPGVRLRSIVQRRPPDTWLAGLILLILMACVHYDVMFLGRSLVLTNHLNPLDYRLLPQNYGDDLVPIEVWTRRNLSPYANIRDPGGSWWQWEPGGEFMEGGIARGEWPFWDPYVGGGAPAMANLTSAFFFPPYALLVAVGHTAARENAYLLVLLWSASFFGYLFLRAHELSFASSVIGAAGIMLSGAVNQHLGTMMGQAAACLTPVLYVTRLFFDASTRGRTLALVLTYAAAALASFPPVLLGVFGLAVFYSVVLVTLGDVGPRSRLRAAVSWVVAVLVSVGLVGFYYVPAASLWTTAAPQVQAVYSGAGLQAIPLDRAYQLLSPTLMGGVPVYLTTPVEVTDGPHIPYVGMAIMLAACLAGYQGGRPRELFIFSALPAILILLKLFGVPPIQWIGLLPGFERIHFAHYFGIPLGFLLAFLAALGIESVRRRWIGNGRFLLVFGLAVVAILSLWRIGSMSGAFAPNVADYWIRDWKVLAVVTGVSGVALALGILTKSGGGGKRAAVSLFFTACVAEGIYNNSYPSPDSWDIFDHPVPYMRFLQQQAGLRRVMAFGAPNANLNSAFEVSTMDSVMGFNPPRTLDLYIRYADAPSSIFMREAKRLPPERVLDRANVGLLGIRDAFADIVQAARDRGYRQIYADGYVSVFERSTPPRFFFSTEYRVAPTQAVAELVAEAPSREVLLEAEPGFAASVNVLDDPDVRVEAYNRNSVKLELNAPRQGLLYAAEANFDGWSAFVNGAPAPILTANYAFRAVVVPQGHVRVEFKYWPPGLTSGLTVSGASAAGLLILILFLRRPQSSGEDRTKWSPSEGHPA